MWARWSLLMMRVPSGCSQSPQPTTPVTDVMRTGFAYVTPNRTVEECMAIMTATKVRHLPVIENAKLVGLVSIGDLVKSIIEDKEFVIDQLTSYITANR